MIHKFADCQNTEIDPTTNVWQFCVILPKSKIGKNCNICAHTFVENDVIIGDNVTIKSGVYIWDGVIIENNVFIGPNVTFTNDKYPRSKKYPKSYLKTTIKEGASIGAGTIIIGGVSIGKNSLVGAGSIVTKNIPDNELWMGSPARFVKKLNEND